MTATIHVGDCRDVLATLPDQSVQTCVTSPPYFGLRDYGVDGQIGLESTVEAFVENLVDVFREVRRVLKDDGTVFLNLGDSYMASGPRQTGRNDTDRETPGGRGGSFRGGPRTAVRAGDAPAYGTSGTAESGCPDRDSSSQNPDGARTGARSSRTTDSGFHPALGQVLEQSVRIRECMEALLDRLPSEGSQGQRPTEQSLVATRDLVRTATRDAGLALASLESMPTESYLQHPEGSRLWDSLSAYQSALRSFAACAQAFVRTSDDVSETPHCTEDNASLVGALEHHIRCIVSCCSIVASWLNPPKIQPQCTTILKPKDLIGVPWRVAFALQADGWYLRSDIIWHKPNPMPESVRDRPTKSHEYLFLLTKAPRYYYDAAAIAEQSDPAQHEHNQKYARPYDNEARIAGGQPGNVNNVGIHSRPGNGTRNKRSVWTVSTQPFSEAHFATFPPKLIEPCILAGSLPRGAYEPDDMILTPTGEGERDDDPSLVTGRAGMNRPRRPLEAVRPMSRAEQAAYAEQLRLSPHRAAMEAEAGATTFAHYIRTDASGARPVPPALLDAWIDRGWLGRISIPPRLADPSRSTVLDPFAGAGTTGLVADRLNRDFIGIELNPEYAEIAKRRIYNDAPMFATVEVLA